MATESVNRFTPEYFALLRAMRSDIESDLLASTIGIAELLRLLAASVDAATHRDIDMLASAGFALAYIGEVLRDKALEVQP